MRAWSKREICFLKENHATLSNKEIAKKLERSISSISHKASKIGLRKKTKEIRVRELLRARNLPLVPYLAGLIDTDGGVYVGITKRKNRWDFYPSVSICQYLAGMIDGDGSISVSIHRARDMKTRFWLEPKVQVSVEAIERFEHILEELCSRLGVAVNFNYYKTSSGGIAFVATFYGMKNVKNLLNLIHPFLIFKKKQASIMLREILPRFDEGKHLTKEGILEIMLFVDQLRSFHGKNNRLKYDTKYFRSLWKDELA